MINILPTDVKEQLEYSKKNVKARNYLLLLITIAFLLTVTLAAAYWYSGVQISNLKITLADRLTQREAYKDTENKVQTLQSNLALIEKLLNQKTQFSDLLSDLAAVLPSGTYINSINLTGDDKKPVQILVSAGSLNQAGSVKNALLQSDRISIVDIQSINQKEDSSEYTVDLIVAFKEGQAR